ncbi:MAG: helix-turn-helix domain-containing protein, partial [Candidatus Eisenbacteria bacterium]|nr:helix-turn-helix domain-containing protein [Candidatus Eisenbacteria bacterium]
VVLIEVPPLRDRREDIPSLATVLVRRLCERKLLELKRLSAECIETLQAYNWPGNVRELENTLERALVLAQGPEIRSEDLHFMRGGAPATETDGGDASDLRLATLESQHILKVLDLTGWRLGRASALLGIDRKTLWRKIRGYRLR